MPRSLLRTLLLLRHRLEQILVRGDERRHAIDFKFLGGGGQAYYNLTAAAAIIAALPPLILALTIQRYLVRGLSFGAVKA